MRNSIILARFARTSLSNPTPPIKEGRYTMRKPLITLVALMAIFFNPKRFFTLVAALMVTTSIATAQTPDPAAPAPAASAGATASAVVFPIKTLQEYIEFIHFLSRYYGIVTQEDFARLAEEGARDGFERVDREHEDITLDIGVLMGEFGMLFPNIQEAFQVEGRKVDPATEASFAAHAKKNGCEATGTKVLGGYQVKTWSPGCEPYVGQLKALFEAKLPKAKKGVPTDNAKHRLEESQGYEGLDAIALAHSALILLNSQLPAADQIWRLDSFFVGRQVCVYAKDKSETCGKIDSLEHDGMTVAGKKIPGDQIVNICFDQEACDAIGSGGGDSDSYAQAHRLELGGRFALRMGRADGYRGFSSQSGFMAVGRVNLLDNVAFQVGGGLGFYTGESEIGTVENDSSTMFMGLAGFRFHMGSRDWLVSPVGELNFTWQGLGPGAEAALGAKISPIEGLDIDVLGSVGVYGTGLTPYLNVDNRDVPSFTLKGGGLVIGASYAW